MIPRYRKQDLFDKIWAPFFGKNLKRGSKNECGGAWETENQLFVALVPYI